MINPSRRSSSDINFPIYSADCHVVEPPDLWVSRMEPALRDRAPRVVQLEDSDVWVVDGVRMAVVGIQAQAGWRYATNASNKNQITKRGFYRDMPDLGPDRYVRSLRLD